jgi:hypothetical protein
MSRITWDHLVKTRPLAESVSNRRRDDPRLIWWNDGTVRVDVKHFADAPTDEILADDATSYRAFFRNLDELLSAQGWRRNRHDSVYRPAKAHKRRC